MLAHVLFVLSTPEAMSAVKISEAKALNCLLEQYD